jgi:hypothetical protein
MTRIAKVCQRRQHNQAGRETHSTWIPCRFRRSCVNLVRIVVVVLQEEIKFLESPECLAALLFTEALNDPEALRIEGAERFSW